MTFVNTRSVTRINRRHLFSLAATATVAVASGNLANIATTRAQATPAATTGPGFLDANLVHDIAVTFDQDAYDAMIAILEDSGDKEWIEAAVSIDGSSYENAGMRLKGNSSLGGFIRPPASGLPEGEEPATGGNEEGPTTHAEGETGELESAEHLPWLIRLDKFVDNQSHGGLTELVIRSNRSETSLNEAVALDLLTLADLDSQLAAATRFSVNDSEPVLRLAIEHPNDAWMAAHFPAGGLLYKAEAGGDFSYHGDDPAAYKDIFDLEAGGTGDDVADMQPLFDFLAFLNDSDDEAFAAELPERLDVEAFATYLAMMDLIGNHDDISGPGNNAYLHVDPGSTQFKVVPWDMNLAFDAFGPGTSAEGGPMLDGTPAAPDDSFVVPDSGSSGGEGLTVIEGTPPADLDCPEDQCTVRMAGPGTPNTLVERCNATAGFTDLVEETRLRLHAELYESGTAADVLAQRVGVLTDQALDVVDEDTIASESDILAQFFTQEP